VGVACFFFFFFFVILEEKNPCPKHYTLPLQNGATSRHLAYLASPFGEGGGGGGRLPETGVRQCGDLDP